MIFVVQLVILQTTFTLLLVQFTDIARKTKKKEIYAGEVKERKNAFWGVMDGKLPWPLGVNSSILCFHMYHKSPHVSCCIEGGEHRNISQSRPRDSTKLP